MGLMWEQCYSRVTIDAICEKAQVKKGSFYHFYKSKAELALAAFDYHWETYSRPCWDRMFSASTPPPDRIQSYLSFGLEKTHEQQREHGRVLGCPFFNVAQETSTIEPEVSQKINELLENFLSYLVTALRDAKSENLTDIEDPDSTARSLFTLVQGSVTQARIKNSLQPLLDLPQAVSRLTGLEIDPLPDQQLAA